MEYPSLSLSDESIQKAFQQPKLEKIRPCKKVKQECEICQYQAASYQVLEFHIKTKHFASQERCNVCDYHHPHPSKMKIHYKWAHLGIELKCEQCNFKTLKYETMRSHVKTKHSKTRQACTECDYSHPLGSKVKAHHRQVHLGIKRVQRNMSCRQGDCQNFGSSGCPESDHFLLYCDYCEYTTPAIEYIKRHIQGRHFSTELESSKGLAYSCESCNYKAKSPSDIARHKLYKHTSEETKQKVLKYKECAYKDCLFKTRQRSRLKIHIESQHEGIIHFRCNYMNCAFKTDDKKSLRRHTKTHQKRIQEHVHSGVLEQKKLIKCKFPKCMFRATKEDVVQHTGSEHAGEVPPHHCHKCNFTFSKKSNFERHKANIHGDNIDS